MTVPVVYADFNAMMKAAKRVGLPEVEMAITGYGTLQSLASQGVRLAEGMPLLLFEPNDIQCTATAHFDDRLVDPAGRVGAWVAVLDPSKIHDSQLSAPSDVSHPCISCGFEFTKYLQVHCRHYEEHCPECGASIMEPMAPPRRET